MPAYNYERCVKKTKKFDVINYTALCATFKLLASIFMFGNISIIIANIKREAQRNILKKTVNTTYLKKKRKKIYKDV